MKGSPYSVIVCDLFNSNDPDHESVIAGFPSRELAVEYARRRTWSSVEEMKGPDISPEKVKERWSALGEDCRVVGPEGKLIYRARSELELFIAQPLPPERRNWVELYNSLLPDDFSMAYHWSAGTYPPPHHYEYTILADRENNGRITFWPDYPGPNVPQWEERFLPSLSARISLVNWLRASGLLDNPPLQSAESLLGGETGFLEITAEGNRTEIYLHSLPDEERRELHEVICSVVPDYIWEKFESQRQNYIRQTYPEE